MKKIEIFIGSSLDYEVLVALLNQDNGKANIKIDFFDDPQIKELDLGVFWKQ